MWNHWSDCRGRQLGRHAALHAFASSWFVKIELSSAIASPWCLLYKLVLGPCPTFGLTNAHGNMQPFATEFCVTARCNTPFERTLRTPRVGVSRGPGPGEIKVPKTEPRFPHEIGYRATRPSTTGYSFGTGFGRPVAMLNVTSSIDKFNTSTSSIGSTTTSSIGSSSPIGNGAASPSFSNYPNPVGRSMWTTTAGNRSFYPLPLGRHTFGVVQR